MSYDKLLQNAINTALDISSNLTDIWTCGDLGQKKKIQNLVFPSGLGYDKSNGKVRTTRVNSIFSCIPEIAKKLKKTKNGKPVKSNQFSAWVTSRVNFSNFLRDIEMFI